MTSKTLPEIENMPVDQLIPYARNARTHTSKQIEQIASSIRQFGFTNPVLIDAGGGIIAGHGRVLAARTAGFKQVPCLRLSHLTEAEKRAYILADNRLAENSEWDEEMLCSELDQLSDLDIDRESLGFDDLDDTQGDYRAEQPHQEVVTLLSTSLVHDKFWISVRGPLIHQARTLQRLRELMAEIPVDVELGTVPKDGLD